MDRVTGDVRSKSPSLIPPGPVSDPDWTSWPTPAALAGADPPEDRDYDGVDRREVLLSGAPSPRGGQRPITLWSEVELTLAGQKELPLQFQRNTQYVQRLPGSISGIVPGFLFSFLVATPHTTNPQSHRQYDPDRLD